MQIEIHFVISGVIILIAAFILSVLQHADKTPALKADKLTKPKEEKEERRLFLRCDASLRATYKTGLMEGIAQVKNVSRGGAGLVLDRALALATSLEMKIDLLHGAKPVFVRAEVIWHKDNEVGVHFSEVDSIDIKRMFNSLGQKYET